jgi:hypothetical protein
MLNYDLLYISWLQMLVPASMNCFVSCQTGELMNMSYVFNQFSIVLPSGKLT